MSEYPNDPQFASEQAEQRNKQQQESDLNWVRAQRDTAEERAREWREKWINDKGIRDARIAELEAALQRVQAETREEDAKLVEALPHGEDCLKGQAGHGCWCGLDGVAEAIRARKDRP